MKPTEVQKAIEERKSTRTFRKEPLAAVDIERITNFLNNTENLVGPFGHQFEFDLLIETDEIEKDQIGSYGFIKNPQGYVLGSSSIETKSLFDFAFVLEGIVLYLTTINIGTCWLGGRFRKQEAMLHMSLTENEIIPAITPVGYPQENQRLKERMIRTVLKARQRKPEEQLFFIEDFGKPLGDRKKDYKQALHYLRIAPSAQNKQPWRLIFNPALTKVHFYVTNPLADNPLYMCEPQYLDIGIAYFHFKAGLDEIGISGDLIIDEPDIDTPDNITYITSWYRNEQ
jgi:nitroreductase